MEPEGIRPHRPAGPAHTLATRPHTGPPAPPTRPHTGPPAHYWQVSASGRLAPPGKAHPFPAAAPARRSRAPSGPLPPSGRRPSPGQLDRKEKPLIARLSGTPDVEADCAVTGTDMSRR